MPDVRLRAWRPSDAPLIAAVREDPHLRHWSSMGDDVARWIERQRVGEHTDVRTIVLDIEVDNVASRRLAERLGAQRRDPPRRERDRAGEPRELVVHVLTVARRRRPPGPTTRRR